MELNLFKIFISLGVPGLALGVFYMLFKVFKWDFPKVPVKWVGPIVVIFMILVFSLTFYTVTLWAPNEYNASNVLNKKEQFVVFHGKGSAIISHQCDLQNENPCPPTQELKRRALEVAKILAMEDISKKINVDVTSLKRVVSGRLQHGVVEMNSGNTLRNIHYLPPTIKDDIISIEINAEVNITN
jgi:hypothetical protein